MNTKQIKVWGFKVAKSEQISELRYELTWTKVNYKDKANGEESTRIKWNQSQIRWTKVNQSSSHFACASRAVLPPAFPAATAGADREPSEGGRAGARVAWASPTAVVHADKCVAVRARLHCWVALSPSSHLFRSVASITLYRPNQFSTLRNLTWHSWSTFCFSSSCSGLN